MRALGRWLRNEVAMAPIRTYAPMRTEARIPAYKPRIPSLTLIVLNAWTVLWYRLLMPFSWTWRRVLMTSSGCSSRTVRAPDRAPATASFHLTCSRTMLHYVCAQCAHIDCCLDLSVQCRQVEEYYTNNPRILVIVDESEAK